MSRVLRLLLALFALSLPLVAVAAGPASASESIQTFSGTIDGVGSASIHLDCAGHGGYVLGTGENRTRPWTQVPFQVRGTLNVNIVYVPVAQNTAAFAFLSRAVTSMSVRVQHLAFEQGRYQVEYACTSNINDAWRVLG